MAKSKKIEALEQQLSELTADLQRTRADFENYRKRVDEEKVRARQAGQTAAVMQLLPMIDGIERAIGHLPDELRSHAWAEGVAGLAKQLPGLFKALQLERIAITPGKTLFDPAVHEAVSAEGEGQTEVITEELQSGYRLDGAVVRHAMVRVEHR